MNVTSTIMLFPRSLPVRECGLKCLTSINRPVGSKVTPCAGVWIEILFLNYAWGPWTTSLPVRECGLKYLCYKYILTRNFVTPCAGVWIEINVSKRVAISGSVTPCAGVWIEINVSKRVAISGSVTPCAGVWIEIQKRKNDYDLRWSLPVRECGLKYSRWTFTTTQKSHSLCGSVD